MPYFTGLFGQFKSGLLDVKGAVAKRTSLPILSHVNLVSDGTGGMKLHATSLDFGVLRSVYGQMEGDRSIALPHQTIVKTLSALFEDNQHFTIDVDWEQLKATFQQGRRKFTVQGMDGDEFPVVNAEGEVLIPVLDGEAFNLAARHVLPAVAKENNRPILQAVNVELAGGTITLVAANGYSLHSASFKEVHTRDFDNTLMLSAELLDKYLSIFSPNEVIEVRIRSDKDRVSSMIFIQPGLTVWMQTLDEGHYMNWRAVVPNPAHLLTFLTVKPEEMLKACAAFASLNQEYIAITLRNFTFHTFEMFTRGDEIGEVVIGMDCKFDATSKLDGQEISLSVDLLRSALRAEIFGQKKDTGWVEIAFSHPTSPVLMRPVTLPAKLSNVVDVVMPTAITRKEKAGTDVQAATE